jgi:hypothetical protein
MKFYGHADLTKNQLQNAALQTLSAYPESPVVGQLAFINSIVMICVQAGPPPVWVPLTREITAYTHIQQAASQTWTINHGLNTSSVNIQIFGSDNRQLIPNEIELTSMTQAVATFGTAIAGKAVVVTGHFDGNVKPTYAYTHYQSESSTSWVITHNLGYNPILRVFIGNSEVQPQSVVHNSTNQVTITFSTAQVGYARLI